MNVLVFAAHPDDEVLGMGSTIALHADRGDAVTVVCLTDGSSAQYAGDDATRAQKNDEAQAAAKVLGVAEYLHLDLPDMRLDTLAHVDVNRVVEEHLRERQAEVVYTAHPDVNLDHRTLFDSVAVATRPTPGQPVRRLLTYPPRPAPSGLLPRRTGSCPTGSSTSAPPFSASSTPSRASRPRSARFHPRNARALEAHAQLHGATVGCEYAEPFVLVRGLER